MSLIPSYRGFNRMFDEMNRNLYRLNHPEFGYYGSPYWLQSSDDFNIGNTSTEVINDATKFSVGLDVTHFKPEELKVRLDDNVLTIEGHHELKDEHSYMQRSFVRKWTLPPECDLEAVKTSLDKKGHLCIEAPKKGNVASASRNIPIEHMK